MSTPTPAGDRPRVLLVGQDRLLAGLVRHALPRERYELHPVAGVDAALEALFSRRPDLVIVAATPDALEGTSSCREVQAVDELPVIVVVPAADTAGAVRALTCADDYVALPVAPEELEARVRAVLRRAAGRGRAAVPLYDDGVLRLDLQNRTASLGGGPLQLTPTEYRLLALLAANPRRLFPHDEILRRVWGSAYTGDSHLLRLQVANLRRKLEPPGGHRYLKTHRGIGYAFEPAPGPAFEPAPGPASEPRPGRGPV